MNRFCLMALVICLSLPLATIAAPSMFPDPSKLKWVLPVRSERLTPGTVQTRALNLPAITPLFLVGQDAVSLEWLSRHAQVLRDLGASGLAVEVADVQALRRIQAAAPGVKIWPVSGDDIAERLELEHYPVLITATSLEQ
ncbi:integrating conjugative element protein [Pseudomonas sp. ITEM 17296]|uniref:integrating conjugative element protein n=1 Tax=Pseudomonas TaxID=286 RepID=UPI00238061C7|nr:integrating conjugative element protein [Pseudomonas sp. ITEM 17296]MDE4536240.1 integrating conjugative element protein [Pseudomonas sp. ITEM 17296]